MKLLRISTVQTDSMAKWSLLITMLLIPLLFSSCMAMMMGSGHEGSAGHSDVIHEKEVQFGKYTAAAAFLPMKAGEETSITLTIVDSQTKLPYPRADVRLNVHMVDSTMDPSMRHMNHGTDSSGMMQMPAGELFQQQLNEGTEQGLYEFLYTPPKEGNYRLILSVSSIAGDQLAKPIFIEAKTVIGHGTSGMGMMGGASTLGIAAVVIMMAIMTLSLIR